MAQFDESKVINALHPEKTEVGKKYWFSDNILVLKNAVEKDITQESYVGELVRCIEAASVYPFQMSNSCSWQFIYPYEEPPKLRMTNIQLMEWLAKGNGVYKNTSGYIHDSHVAKYEDSFVEEGLLIKSWDSDEWVEPTLDIYERDCKGGTK